jgi:hypothetical protein
MLCVITSFMLLYVKGGSFMDELLHTVADPEMDQEGG